MTEPSYAELRERLERADGNADRQERLIAELSASKERYHTLFKSTDEGYCIIELINDEHGNPIDWRFLETNPAFEIQNGTKNAAGNRVREVVPDLDPKWLKIYGEVARTGKPIRFQSEDNEFGGRWFDLYAFRIGEPSGDKVAIIFRDITAGKQAEAVQKALDQQVRDQQFYTRSLIEANVDAILTCDPSGIITDANTQWEALTGCTRDELVGSLFRNYFTDPERAGAVIKQVLGERKVTDYELTVRNRDGGRETLVSFNATTFYDRNRNLQGVFASAREVIVRKA